MNPPWGGHGFNTSVGDSVNIAWKIAAVLPGWAPERLLASYEPERRQVVEQTVASAGSHLRNLASDLAQDEETIRRLKSPEFFSLGLVLGYSYAGSPIVAPPTGPGTADPGAAGRGQTGIPDVTSYVPTSEPGARLPHWWLPDGSSLYDHLGQGFTLLCPESAASGPGSGVAALAERAARGRIPLAVLRAPASYPWAQEFLLVRPDQHIAWRAGDAAGIDLEAAVGLA